MNESEVRKLFLVIQNTYNGFDYDDDKVAVWHDVLKETPFELAQRNLRAHILSVKFPPVPAEIAMSEAEPEQLALYHEDLRTSAQQHLSNLEEWAKTATPPPEHVRERLKKLGIIRNG
ncbi:replicative helicase loader/inhibitor [Paenibacillus foliorum]|uniref:replicative helicase loader/inhibitor n=1 Tax=Paenibacillus foliorum TaxID=2654974 RepID=UPI001492E996|nr:replicative helicase loader/inhibitor [Paenibacillus foliorum]